MKKIIFLVNILCAMEGYSQFIQNSVVIMRGTQLDVRHKKNKIFIDGFTNNISTNVYRAFLKMFGDLSEVHWIVDREEVTAFFSDSSESVLVGYKMDGYLLSVRKVYGVTRLDSLVRKFIDQQVEKDFIIDQVTEVMKGGVTFYEISLFNEKQICIIRLDKNEDGRLSMINRRLLTKG